VLGIRAQKEADICGRQTRAGPDVCPGAGRRLLLLQTLTHPVCFKNKTVQGSRL